MANPWFGPIANNGASGSARPDRRVLIPAHSELRVRVLPGPGQLVWQRRQPHLPAVLAHSPARVLALRHPPHGRRPISSYAFPPR